MAEGFSLALDAAPLDADPVWTRIDNLDGVTIQSVDIERGRSDETEKTAIGTMTVRGTDRIGALDPTNTTGPYYGKLDPVKQVIFAAWNPVTDEWFTRFRGYWDELTYTIHPSGKFATFVLECVDALDILDDAEIVPDQAGNTVPVESSGDVFYEGAQVDDRIRAAIADAATALFGVQWPSGLLSIFSGNVAVQGTVYAGGTTQLTVIQEAADAEFPCVANFFADRIGRLSFRGRYSRFHPDVEAYGIGHWYIGDDAAATDDSTYARMAQPFSFARGKANLLNAVLSYPKGIAPADTGAQMASDSTSISTYGVRSTSFPDLITAAGDETSPLDAKDETKLYGTYMVDNYKTPHDRPGTITVQSLPPADALAAAIWALLKDIELSDLATLKTIHPGGGGFDNVDFFVEKITEHHVPRRGEEGGDQITMQLEVSPRAYYDTNPFTGDPHHP